MLGVWWAIAVAAGTPCALGTVVYDATVVHMELTWDAAGKELSLRCRDPARPELTPPSMKLEATRTKNWAEGETLQNTIDVERRAQFTGEIDAYLEKEKLSTSVRFAVSNLLSFDCVTVWQQWAEVVGPSCGGLSEGVTVIEGVTPRVLQRIEDFDSSLIGKGNMSDDDLVTQWTMSDDGWAEQISVVHQRDGKTLEEKLLTRFRPGDTPVAPDGTASTPTTPETPESP